MRLAFDAAVVFWREVRVGVIGVSVEHVFFGAIEGEDLLNEASVLLSEHASWEGFTSDFINLAISALVFGFPLDERSCATWKFTVVVDIASKSA